MTNYEDYLKQVADLGGANTTQNSFLELFIQTEYGEGYTYEGDLLNNLPNNYGRVYYPSKEVFEDGQWENGKLNGNGKRYFCWGGPNPEDKYKGRYLRFEGVFNQGELKKGIIYRPQGDRLFEGEFKDEKLNGLGKVYQLGKILEEGYFINGELDGMGQKYFQGKIEKIGSFKTGKLNGKGKIYNPLDGMLIAEGYFTDDKLNGFGTTYHYYSDGSINEHGNFINGIFQGK